MFKKRKEKGKTTLYSTLNNLNNTRITKLVIIPGQSSTYLEVQLMQRYHCDGVWINYWHAFIRIIIQLFIVADFMTRSALDSGCDLMCLLSFLICIKECDINVFNDTSLVSAIWQFDCFPQVLSYINKTKSRLFFNKDHLGVWSSWIISRLS